VRPDGSPSRREEGRGRRGLEDARSGSAQGWVAPSGALRGPLRLGRGVRVRQARRDTDGDAGAVGPKAASRSGNSTDARESAVCPSTRPPVHRSMPMPSAWACPRQGRALALSSEFFPSAGLGADPGVHGEACPELVETPPPWSHWRISVRALRRVSTGRAKSRSTSQFSKKFAPSCTAQHGYYQRCWTPIAVLTTSRTLHTIKSNQGKGIVVLDSDRYSNRYPGLPMGTPRKMAFWRHI
jgi:hypothetical protein